MDKNQIIKQAEKLLKASKNIVMVLTVDKDGAPHGRYMDCTKAEGSLALYFATFINTDKVGQIRNNPKAEIIAVSKGLAGVANLSGTISFCGSQEGEAFEGKKSFLISRFPGINAEDIVILKFIPKAIKYLDQKSHFRPLPIYKAVL